MGNRSRTIMSPAVWAALLVVAGFVFAQLFADWQRLQAMAENLQKSWAPWSAALLVYFASHGVRFLRFAMLVKGQRLRYLLQIYALTTGASFAMPFKSGELFRMLWIGLYAKNLGRGLIVVWVERILDASMIALIYLLVALTDPDIRVATLSGALILIPLLIVFSVLILKVLPENMNNLNLWILRSYKGSAATQRLKWLERVRKFTSEANETLANRALSLVMLTLSIWGLEIYATFLALQPEGGIQNGLSVFVSKMAFIINPSSTGFSNTMKLIEGFTLLQGLLIGSLAVFSIVWVAMSVVAKRLRNPT